MQTAGITKIVILISTAVNRLLLLYETASIIKLIRENSIVLKISRPKANCHTVIGIGNDANAFMELMGRLPP